MRLIFPNKNHKRECHQHKWPKVTPGSTNLIHDNPDHVGGRQIEKRKICGHPEEDKRGGSPTRRVKASLYSVVLSHRGIRPTSPLT